MITFKQLTLSLVLTLPLTILKVEATSGEPIPIPCAGPKPIITLRLPLNIDNVQDLPYRLLLLVRY